MTREELLARLANDRADALRQGWTAAAIGAVLIAGAAWFAREDGHSAGTTLAFAAGGAAILMALARRLTPRPSYGGGRLEVRASPIGLVMAAALLVVVAAAVAYALSAHDLFRRVELSAALALVIVLMLMNWGLSLGTGPVVVVDGEGFRDRRATRGVIPWDQLEPIQVQWVRNQAYYRVQPKDPSRLTLLARLNALVGFSGFAINGLGLDHGEGDVLLAIHAYRPDLLSNL